MPRRILSGRRTLRRDGRARALAPYLRGAARGPTKTPAASLKLSGHIPKKLTCSENDSVRLGKVAVTPGAYHLVVAVPSGPSGSDVKYSFVRRPLSVKR
jgi:hypothetical protein